MREIKFEMGQYRKITMMERFEIKCIYQAEKKEVDKDNLEYPQIQIWSEDLKKGRHFRIW